jgi:N-acetylneuraminic acid mutarotase
LGYLNDLWRWDGANWTWMSGSNAANEFGLYGTKGVPDPANVPGARGWAVSWTDASGNLWLFGGFGYAASGFGYLNDLWRWDGANWTWMSGNNAINQLGVYGTKGVPDLANVPGARYGAVSWTDATGNLWLFGGYGGDASGGWGILNDLWRWDGTNWTWMSGSNIANQYGVYGTKGVPAAANVPGARWVAVSWIDATGDLWLFGGFGRDTSGSEGWLNDLWRWDGAYWTWMSGSSVAYQYGVYGTKGVPASTNVPGGRCWAVSWSDATGNLWLFGGWGYPASGLDGDLNDLWRYTP